MEKNIDHLIGKDGSLKPGVILSQREYLAACGRGLKSAAGQSLKLVEPIPDLMSAKNLRKQAPAELTNALEQAQARLKESHEITNKLFGAWIESKRAKQRFTAAYGETLTDEGKTKSDELDRAIGECERNLADAEDCATMARIEVINAEQQLDQWLRGKRLEIETGSAEAIAKSTGQDRSIGARLRRLKDAIAG